jgi:gamma-glutamyl hercynylcysteine S-oxide synthase
MRARGRLPDTSMATSPVPTANPEALTGALAEARDRTFALVASISDCDLERVHSRLMSPLVWDLGHIAAFEDLWLVHRFGGEDMVRRDLAEVYDAFETPRHGRGDLPFLGPDDAREYLAEVRERALAATERLGPGDGLVHELVVRHEHQPNETMLQTMALARLDCFDPAEQRAAPPAPGGHTGLELVDVPGGPCEVGAPAAGFAYDNERPRHRIELPPFRIGLTPVTNATFLSFAEGGGYERREWWTDEAWHWKEEYDIAGPRHWSGDGHEWVAGEWTPIDPDKPVAHVSWFEADAFARAHGARLPTEFEWEKAATWDQETGRALDAPWGGATWTPERANLDHLTFGTAPAGAYPDGAAPSGCLGMLGDVWEWTSSRFDGYPGFVAHPYREYSEVFFGQDYRVLRGGSWATRARVATPTFRNWDFPQRRQIFSGLRIARDAAG